MKLISIFLFLLFFAFVSIFPETSETVKTVNSPVDTVSTLVGALAGLLTSLGGQWTIFGKWLKRIEENHETILKTVSEVKTDMKNTIKASKGNNNG